VESEVKSVTRLTSLLNPMEKALAVNELMEIMIMMIILMMMMMNLPMHGHYKDTVFYYVPCLSI
jgi:hypothetical protein